jgi:hypothetical protein
MAMRGTERLRVWSVGVILLAVFAVACLHGPASGTAAVMTPTARDFRRGDGLQRLDYEFAQLKATLAAGAANPGTAGQAAQVPTASASAAVAVDSLGEA